MKKMQNILINMGDEKDQLMKWELVRYPKDAEKLEGTTVVEFNAVIINEDFGKNYFGFLGSEDEKESYWIMDLDGRLSEKELEKIESDERLHSGVTMIEFDTPEEALAYISYVYEMISMACFVYSDSKQDLTKQ
jgi:hypothetical protein